MALLFISDVDPVGWWRSEIAKHDRDLEFVPFELKHDADSIRYALVWNPPTGVLAKYSNLKVVFSLGAGVDHILKDGKFPRQVPLVRVIDDNLTRRMVEYVVMHCLMETREQRTLDEFQRRGAWRTDKPITAADVRVGIMGLGVLGRAVALKLSDLGFQVAGWAQSNKDIPNVKNFIGHAGLGPFLSETDILVCLLPHTPATENLLDLSLLRLLAKDGVLNGPILINVGRGKVLVDDDVLEALDCGVLRRAILDVFRVEPLPSEDRFWSHPLVTVTPHCAAVSDPRGIAHSVMENISRFERREPLNNIVDLGKGY
jgi:glyoxylate/hydroxypyruvate reductase A